MAAYAALTSLMHIIDQIEHHPSPPISLHKQQVQSLTQEIIFLQNFLDTYHSPYADSDEADPLEMRISDAAYAAEDVIESQIVFQLSKSGEESVDSQEVFQGLQKVIKEMNLIKEEIKKKKITVVMQRNVSTSFSSSRSSIMVKFGDVLLEIMDKLTAEQLNRQVIPIVGMGGIGKTTLALQVYALPVIKERFDICAWATISQQYNMKKVLCELLSQANKKNKDELSNMSEDELGLALHKCLFSRRFLIVMDDMWSIDAWNRIQCFFPENNNSSRVLVTTRLSNLGFQLDNYYCLKMKFLDEVNSWSLFSKTVFGEESCPPNLKEIGKKIVESCKGLPLSIVVVGGLLKKLEHTQECWESIRKNSSSIVNSEKEEFCFKILKMSYNHLPVHLKPCFLYMGVFDEDCVVRVSTLVKLWVSEGFMKPSSDQSLETTAKEYLYELVDRNLILVHELGSTGNIKSFKIHDLLRDLCCREAEKERFYNVIGQHKSQRLDCQRRVVINHGRASMGEVDGALQSMPLARSFLCDTDEVVRLPKLKLLRVMKTYDRDTSRSHDYLLDDLFGFVNSRYLAARVHWESKFPTSLSLVWNLQTLIIYHSSDVVAPPQLWKMSQLRHVVFHKGYLDVPCIKSSDIVTMKNIQTLKGVRGLVRDMDIPSMIPNIRKMGVVGALFGDGLHNKDFHLKFPNIRKMGVVGGALFGELKYLRKLESFRWRFSNVGLCSFPHSLKKLSLGSSSSSHWDLHEGMLKRIGKLPHLQKLKLERAEFKRPNFLNLLQWELSGGRGDKYLQEWETSEGRFCSLKYLELKWCIVRSWRTESSHFPRLEQLHLYGLRELEQISSEIGEIPTMQSIHLEYCSQSAVVSAKNIAEEQEELQVRVVLFNTEKNQTLRRLSSHNFVVEIVDL